MEQVQKKMGSLKFLIFVELVVYPFIWTSVDGSSLSGRIKGPPSPPRNLRRSIVGILPSDREYKVFWSASHNTGGLAVNYTVKLCMNDIYEPTNSCKWSSNPQCRPTNILSTNKEFSCVLDWRRDLFNSCTWFCDYNVCVLASNDVSNVTTCIFAPHAQYGLVTPLPPLDLTTESDGDGIRVKWKEREVWKSYNRIYTVLYHAERQRNQTKEVKEPLTRLTSLKKFTNYCVYVRVQTLSTEGVRSAPSDLSGPRCLKTIAGNPSDPPTVKWDKSMVFPDNAELRNVTVQWKLVQNSSWHGTPHEYRIYCNYHLLKKHRALAKACEYYTDAATNRTVLQGLNSADSYNVYIEICNKEKKCSGPGEPYLVNAIQDNVSQPVEQGQWSAKQMGLIVGSVAFGCISAGVLSYLFIKWYRERKLCETRESLNKIIQLNNPGDLHDYHDMEPEGPHQYSRVYRPANDYQEIA